MSAAVHGEPPRKGLIVRDTRRNRTGTFEAVQSGRYVLRPVGGGKEWEASPEDVEAAPEEAAKRSREELARRVHRANLASRARTGATR
jgi:hypothetical protein